MRILIVDDSMFVRMVIKKNLLNKFDDIQITECENGLEAFDAYRDNEFDFILTDLLMPIMTGQQFLEKIESLGKPYNCVVCSADIQEGTRKELEAFDIIDVIAKPLTPDKLEQVANYLKEYCNG